MTYDKRDNGESYLAVATVVVTTIGGLAIAGAAGLASLGSPLHLWLAAGVVPLLYVVATAWWANRSRSIRSRPSMAKIALYLLALGLFGSALSWVLVIGHRFSVLPIALAQAAILAQFSPQFRKPIGFVALFVAASFAWALESAIMWLPLDDFLMSGSRLEAWATVSFVLVLAVISIDALQLRVRPSRVERSPRAVRRWIAIAASLLFLELGLRTDRLLADWIPYHRSYFTGPAEFIRQGHWLLWDVPSQYGFLSVLSVALFPGANAWQSLYLLTAVVLAVQAMLLFWILRFGRQGWLNAVASVTICAAIFYGNQAVRAPFGAQLYPQEGLRFIWTITMLCSMLGAYAYRSQPSLARWYWCAGWASWLISILWSFETGVMATVAWCAYLSTDSIVRILQSKHRLFEVRVTVVRHVLPIIALPSASIAGIALYYQHFLGRFPDWSSYAEFSNLYAAGKVAEAQQAPLQLFGTGLALVALLTGIATIAGLVLSRKAFEVLPLVTGCAAAAWSTSAYFVAEPFNQHVNAIICVFAVVFGIYAIVARELNIRGISLRLAQVMILPVHIMFSAQFIGEPAQLRAMSAPLFPKYNIADASGFPPIQGQLASLVRSANITRTDRIALPDVLGGAKLSSGVFMPFVRLADGRTVELKPWLPTTPVGAGNALLTLPPERREQYMRRFLALGKPIGGWLFTYYHIANCHEISPTLKNVRSVRLGTFSGVLCDFNPIVQYPEGSPGPE